MCSEEWRLTLERYDSNGALVIARSRHLVFLLGIRVGTRRGLLGGRRARLLALAHGAPVTAVEGQQDQVLETRLAVEDGGGPNALLDGGLGSIVLASSQGGF